MADNRILEDGLRGALAGIRGVIEAKVMAHQARTEREKRISDQAYRQQMANLDERRVRISELSQEDQSATLALKQESEKEAAAAEKTEQERVSKLQAKYEEIAAKITEIDTRYEAAEDDTEKQQIAGERRVAQNELSILGTQLKYSQPKEAAMPELTADEKWNNDMAFIQARVDAGELTPKSAKKARELALKKFLKLPITEADDPLTIYVAREKAISAAIEEGTISGELGQRFLESTESEIFPQEKVEQTPTEELKADLDAIDALEGKTEEEKNKHKDSIISDFAKEQKKKLSTTDYGRVQEILRHVRRSTYESTSTHTNLRSNQV